MAKHSRSRRSWRGLTAAVRLVSRLSQQTRRESGVALVLTVLVLTIVLVVTAQIVLTVRTESLVVANQSQDQSLSLLAPGAVWHLDALFQADDAGELTVGEFDLTKADTRAEPFMDPLAINVRTFNSELGSVSYEVEDLERRFNLNWLVAQDEGFRKHAEGALSRLVVSLGHPPEFADALKQFIQGTDGTETDDGQGQPGQGTPLGQPTNPSDPNAPGQLAEGQVPPRQLLSLDDLYDMEFEDLPRILTGTDENGELLTEVKPFFDFVTVRNTPGLNFNTAPGELLASWLPAKDKAQPNANDLKGPTRNKAAKELIGLRIHTLEEESFGVTPDSGETPPGEQDPQPAPEPTPQDPDSEDDNPNQSEWIGKEPFTKLADIAKAPTLKNIFSSQDGKGPGAQGQPGGAGAGAGAGAQQTNQGPKNWYDVLTFRSRLFKVTVRASSNDGQQKVFEAIVFRSVSQDGDSGGAGAPQQPAASAAAQAGPPTKVLEWRDITDDGSVQQ